MLVTRLAISLMFGGAALYVLLGRREFPDATVKWAIGLLGLIIGYWLR